jgi:hypothetical protein
MEMFSMATESCRWPRATLRAPVIRFRWKNPFLVASKMLTRAVGTGTSWCRWLSISDFRRLRSTLHPRPLEGTPALNCINDEKQFRLFRPGPEPIIYCVTNCAAESPLDPPGKTFLRNRFPPDRKIYIASKVTHAARWLDLRDDGWPIISTWIDEAGEGESKSLADLTLRCIAEAASCTHFILYSEEDEILKGALLECGAALANEVPVYCVGGGPSISHVFEKHPCWRTCDTVEDALRLATMDHADSREASPFNLEARFALA